MRLFNINLCDARVVLHHVQCAVPKQCLQGEHIAAGAEIRNREGVPEAMGMAFGYARLLTEMDDLKP